MIKKLFTFLSCFAVAAALSAKVLSPAEKTFEVDYRNGKTDAVLAKGNAAATILHNETPEFSKQGLLVGEGKASLRYDTAGNLNPASGAIEILFENTTLNWNDKRKHILLQCIGKNLTLYIYKHSTDGLGAFFGNREPKWNAFSRAVPSRLGEKKLYHLVINYSAESVQCFVDRINLPSTKHCTSLSE